MFVCLYLLRIMKKCNMLYLSSARGHSIYPQQRGSISWGLSSNGENPSIAHAHSRINRTVNRSQSLTVRHIAVLILVRYKIFGFEAGGRGQEAGVKCTS